MVRFVCVLFALLADLVVVLFIVCGFVCWF